MFFLVFAILSFTASYSFVKIDKDKAMGTRRIKSPFLRFVNAFMPRLGGFLGLFGLVGLFRASFGLVFSAVIFFRSSEISGILGMKTQVD